MVVRYWFSSIIGFLVPKILLYFTYVCNIYQFYNIHYFYDIHNVCYIYNICNIYYIRMYSTIYIMYKPRITLEYFRYL